MLNLTRYSNLFHKEPMLIRGKSTDAGEEVELTASGRHELQQSGQVIIDGKRQKVISIITFENDWFWKLDQQSDKSIRTVADLIDKVRPR